MATDAREARGVYDNLVIEESVLTQERDELAARLGETNAKLEEIRARKEEAFRRMLAPVRNHRGASQPRASGGAARQRRTTTLDGLVAAIRDNAGHVDEAWMARWTNGNESAARARLIRAERDGLIRRAEERRGGYVVNVQLLEPYMTDESVETPS